MKGDARPLTPGERALVAEVFGDAIDPDPVVLHHAKWWVFQPARVTMAPDGHIWFHPNDEWHPDFALAPLGAQGHFVHEMVHVWQHQSGIDLRFRRPPFARYRYRLVPGKPFGAYGMEQQAEIVRHAFLLSRGCHIRGCSPLAEYRALLPFEGRYSQSVLV